MIDPSDIEMDGSDPTAEIERLERALAAALVQLREARHRQLVQNEKLAAVGELIAGVAHEINNPLAVMLGYVNLVTHELGPTAWSVRMEVDLILQQIARVQRIIDSLLYIARPKRDVAVLTPEDLSHPGSGESRTRPRQGTAQRPEGLH